MDPYLVEWMNLLTRWGHMIAGIAWIGTSFYFVALDLSLRRAANSPAGVGGEAWEVHGGGFYHVQKYLVAPSQLPDHLIWFKWEAYLTWVTGFILLILQYYINASSFLIDANVLQLNAWQAIGISVGGLVAGWLIYDMLCRSALVHKPQWLALAVFALILAGAYGFSHVFSGRGAFIHIGAFIGTIMAANVFMVIIPNQRKITAALLQGEKPDPRFAITGKQRSLHNTYLTLPVLFMMTSNHYSMITENPYAWILVGLIVLGGAGLRHFLLRVEVGQPISEMAWVIPMIGVALAGALWLTEPEPVPVYTGTVSDDEALLIVQARCSACHARVPTDPTIKSAPKGIELETLENLKRFAQQVDALAVKTKAMPLGNKTKMEPEERAKLGAWIHRQ